MSSRSLAAARARRAGESAPPVSGNRPGTSVGSAAAFSGMPQPPNNVRVARQQPPQQYQQYQQTPPQQYQQMQYQQMPPQQYQQMPPQQYQQMPPQQKQQSATFQQIQQQQQNALPFSKLSISDAIGLITLRLGRVEQWVIETEHENETKEQDEKSASGSAVDNSVLVGLLNRLEAVEKKEPIVTSNNSEEITKLTSELASLSERYNKFCDEANKQTLTIAKHTEQLFRFERELVETKDILKTFMIRYDNFVQESNDKLADYEYAIAEIEKSIAPTANTDLNGTTIEGLLPSEPTTIPEIINPDDLKSLVKQELSAIDA
jgi:hypothetical protein